MKKTYLVTGGAGFIGSNFIHYLLEKHKDILIINVDKLTYAGNLENLASVIDDKRHVFVQADICDKEAMEKIFSSYPIDYVVNFAAESHVDRSIKDPDVFARTNVMGTLNLLNLAKAAWQTGDDTYRTGSSSNRFLRMRCMGIWAQKASLPRQHLLILTAPTLRARQQQTCSCRPMAIPTSFP